MDGSTNTVTANVTYADWLLAAPPAPFGLAIDSATNMLYAVSGQSVQFSVNHSAQCTATVTDTSSTPTSPTGAVSLVTNSSGTFTPSGGCNLSPSSSSASSCTLSYSPDLGSDGTHRIAGTYSADSTHFATRGSFNLAVTKRSTSNSVSCAGHSGKFACTASISDTSLGLPLTRTDSVTWTSSSTSKKSAFVPPSCTLSGTGPTASCSVSFTNPGKSMTVTITATYSGDAGHFGSTGSTTLTT